MEKILLQGEKNQTKIEIFQVRNKYLLHLYQNNQYVDTYYFYSIIEAQQEMLNILNQVGSRKYGNFTVIDGGKV